MVNTYDDEEASRVTSNDQVEIFAKKENFLRKAFLGVMLAFVVVGSITSQNSLGKPVSSSNLLFGERSLKGLVGLCCKKKDPTPPPPADDGFILYTWDETRTNFQMTSGEQRKYKTVVPAGSAATVSVNFDPTGGVSNDAYLSFSKTMPADTSDTDNYCYAESDTTFALCQLAARSQEATVYAWVNAKNGNTVGTIRIGNDPR